MSFSSMLYDIALSFRVALKARFLLISAALLLFVMLVSGLAALFSARQPATVFLDVGISLVRFALPLLIILMSQELISKEFDLRYYLVSLAYPRQRAAWLISRVAAVYCLGFAALLVAGMVLAILVSFTGSGYDQATKVDLKLPYLIVMGMVAVDLFVITAVAALLAVVARTPSFVLIGSIGFMLIARSYASVIDLLEENIDPVLSKVVDQETYVGSLSMLKLLLPDLGALDVRFISLYSQMTFLPADWFWSALGALGYAIALLGLASWWMGRRQFR